MEDRKLDNQESLELICRMIQHTQCNLDAGSGNQFLLWGYVCTLTTIAVAAALYFTKSSECLWGFFAIPLIGTWLMFLLKRKEKQKVMTYADKVIDQMWLVLNVFCWIVVLMSLLVWRTDLILPLVAIVISLGSIITGIAIRQTAFSVLSSVGAVLGLYMLLNVVVEGHFSFAGLWLFVVVEICSLIIPGHILNAKARKTSRNIELTNAQTNV
ncbi:MAG: hypothetical protein RR365_04660 [Bacteroides sp.]